MLKPLCHQRGVMRIAYIILAHKYPEQLVRLVSRLNTETASFFIHIDQKTDDAIYHRMVTCLSGFSNVYFIKRYKYYWAEFGSIDATLEGIKEVLNKKIPFDYVSLLTGQDYPIKTNKQIEEFLQKNQGKSFIAYEALPRSMWGGNGGFDRINYWHFRVFNKRVSFPPKPSPYSRVSLLRSILNVSLPFRRKFPQGFKPFGGYPYWSLSRECVEYIIGFANSNHRFVDFFKYVHAPDEMFFQTIILNSPIKEGVIRDNLRYVSWPKAHSGHPKTLTKNDFDLIAKSTKLFARKFDITEDEDILNMIDQKILYSSGLVS